LFQNQSDCHSCNSYTWVEKTEKFVINKSSSFEFLSKYTNGMLAQSC
jgi:hypothetical protein